MSAMEYVYLICFFLGLGYAIISGLMSGVFSGGAEGAGDLDFSADGADGHDGPTIDSADGGHVHLPIVSPITIAMFITCFGGTGIIIRKVTDWSPLLEIPASAASGFVGAAIVFYLFYKIFSVTGGSSAAKISDVLGSEGQITTPIPVNGVGEVSYSVGSSRQTAPARSVDGKEVGSQSVVRIKKIVGNIYYVERVT